MLASKYFDLKLTLEDDWFDVILDADTELFVDPFLVFKETVGFWRVCGADLIRGEKYCGDCAVGAASKNLIQAAKTGRSITHGTIAQARRSKTMRKQQLANLAWVASDQPHWLNLRTYTIQIQPLLRELALPRIALVLGVSQPYATHIRRGMRIPHPRHWVKLASLVGVTHAND